MKFSYKIEVIKKSFNLIGKQNPFQRIQHDNEYIMGFSPLDHSYFGTGK